MTTSRPPARAEEPDRDLIALGFRFEHGVLYPPAPCGVKVTPIRNRYLIKIALPTGGSALVFDIPKHQLKIAFNKRAKP
jgi:hypothetical protein